MISDCSADWCIRRKKGIWFDRGTTFLWFWWVFWPQSSLIIYQKPGQRLSGIDYVFTTNTWHQDNKKNTIAVVLALLCVVEKDRTCIFIFCWMEKSQIYTRICLPSDSFVSPGRIFFPGFLWLCLGGLRDKKKRGKEKPIGLSTTESLSRAKLSSHLD